jgi:hypothetical protein
MDAGTYATIGTTITSFLALAAYLRAEIKDVRADIRRLDDRVYALATGIKPLIDQVQRSES